MCRPPPLFFISLDIVLGGSTWKRALWCVCTGAHMEARGQHWVSYVSPSITVRQGDSVNVVLTILDRRWLPSTVLMWASHWAQLCNTRPSCLHSEHFTPRTFSRFCFVVVAFEKYSVYLYKCLPEYVRASHGFIVQEQEEGTQSSKTRVMGTGNWTWVLEK